MFKVNMKGKATNQIKKLAAGLALFVPFASVHADVITATAAKDIYDNSKYDITKITCADFQRSIDAITTRSYEPKEDELIPSSVVFYYVGFYSGMADKLEAKVSVNTAESEALIQLERSIHDSCSGKPHMLVGDLEIAAGVNFPSFDYKDFYLYKSGCELYSNTFIRYSSVHNSSDYFGTSHVKFLDKDDYFNTVAAYSYYAGLMVGLQMSYADSFVQISTTCSEVDRDIPVMPIIGGLSRSNS